jgi:hypothetical protein
MIYDLRFRIWISADPGAHVGPELGLPAEFWKSFVRRLATSTFSRFGAAGE